LNDGVGDVGGLADVEEGGDLGAGVASAFEDHFEVAGLGDLIDNRLDIGLELAGDGDEELVHLLLFGLQELLGVALERAQFVGLHLRFLEEVLALFLGEGGVTDLVAEVLQFLLGGGDDREALVVLEGEFGLGEFFVGGLRGEVFGEGALGIDHGDLGFGGGGEEGGEEEGGAGQEFAESHGEGCWLEGSREGEGVSMVGVVIRCCLFVTGYWVIGERRCWLGGQLTRGGTPRRRDGLAERGVGGGGLWQDVDWGVAGGREGSHRVAE